MSSRDRLRLAVSLRVDRAAGHGERRDALAQDWYEVFARWEVDPVLVPNRRPVDLAWLDADAVLLTGGNTPAHDGCVDDDVAPERDATETALLDYARARRIPILGVCRGAQFIALRFGARLRRVEPARAHVACEHVVHWRSHDADHTARVNSFHDYAIETVGFPAALDVLATADDGTVEAFRHPHEAIAGVVWHPERAGGSDPVFDGFLSQFLNPGPVTEAV